MTATRGQHLNFLAILCCGWLAARTVVYMLDGAPSVVEERRRTAVAVAAPARPPAFPVPAAAPENLPGTWAKRDPHKAIISGSFGRIALRGQNAVAAQMIESEPWPVPAPARVDGAAAPIVPTFAHAPKPAKGGRALTAETYAYSLWREGRGSGGLAPRGQYGGGQSGVISTFALQSEQAQGQPQRLALLVRAAIAHDDTAERELGLGVRWRPLKSLPVSVTAERRIRNGRADAFAAYVAGGVSEIPIAYGFKLGSFAQAGGVSGANGGAFFDGFARADRRLLQQSALSLHGGGGVWAGGQKGAGRVDIGPSLRADIRINTLPLRIGADWRFRVAGDARPGNGPALTLSTGF